VAALGWFSINSIIATQSLAQVMARIGLPASPALSWGAMLIVLAAETLIAIYGHATIIAAEKFVAVALFLLFAGFLAIVVPHVDWARAMSGPAQPAGFGVWLVVVGLVFSYPISWTNFASDYSRYLPRDTPWRRVAAAAAGGQFVALVFCEIIGVIFATAVGGALSDPVADLPKILPGWYLTPFLLAVILGSIATNVPNGYTAGLGLLALRIPIRRVTSILAIAFVTLAVRMLTLIYGHFFDLYQQWLQYILIWTCPWVAIVVVDYFLRGGRYDGADLMAWGRGRYWYKDGLFRPGLIAFFAGLAAFFLFANSDMFASPLMTRWFDGADLSFEAGMLAAGLIYYALARRAKP
jgi:NCS1 family nucleobase:cation symporter-1